MAKNIIIGQSGGPTAVINSSLAGVYKAARSLGADKVYGMKYGIEGLLKEELLELNVLLDDRMSIELLKRTPSSYLGSCRYKLPDPDTDSTPFVKLFTLFDKYDICAVFYIGGNDSMDTCNKISKFLNGSGWDCNVIGVPKTIDNDLFGTDHCPGFASAAKYIATTLMEINLDAKVYNTGMVCVIEVMGRNAGWLTAAASLAGYKGLGADLIYLPEVAFDVDKFVSDVEGVLAKNDNKCIAVVSEGIKLADGRYVGEFTASKTDLFGHAQLGGVGQMLANVIKEKTGIKTRAIELSLMQRCGAHLASKVDVEEAFGAGAEAVKAAVSGETDKMVCFERDMSTGRYVCKYKLLPLELAANTEKTVPLDWITNNGTALSDKFVEYALPLIQGDAKAPLEDGLPRFAKLKKVLVEKL